MTGADLVAQAAAELYGGDLAEFTERRKRLAGQARRAGDARAAKQIERLRKPTRAAQVVNRLVRADPSVPARLIELGDQLRAAEAALDGAKLRELSRARRELMDALLRQASRLPDQPAPSGSAREEIAATFDAALADPGVAQRLMGGTLERAASRAGFGFPEGPALALVPQSPPRHVGSRAAPARSSAETERPSRAARGKAEPEQRPAAARRTPRAAREKAEREQRRAIANAERALREADRAVGAAADAEGGEQRKVRRLEEELAEARDRLAAAQLALRRAERARREARRALDRLGK